MLHIGRKRAGLVKKDLGNKIDVDHKEGYVRSEYEAMYIMIKRVEEQDSAECAKVIKESFDISN